MRDPFAAPRQTIPDPHAQETFDAWSFGGHRNPLAKYAPLWVEPPEEPEPALEQVPDGPSTWAEQEQASIKEHAA